MEIFLVIGITLLCTLGLVMIVILSLFIAAKIDDWIGEDLFIPLAWVVTLISCSIVSFILYYITL